MMYIIIGLIVIGIVYAIIEWLKDTAGVWLPILLGVGVLVVAFFAAGWVGVLAVIGIAIGVALLAALVSVVTKSRREHDSSVRQTAQLQLDKQRGEQAHENDKALLKELNDNCKYLGFMNDKMWNNKLSNYVDRPYSTNFNEMTRNFAKQMEEQNITGNDEWFEPFMNYIISHPAGSTIVKLLSEVKCKQFQTTHITPNKTLLERKLEAGTKDVSKDVKALFNATPMNDGQILYTPTRYLLHREGLDNPAGDNGSNTNSMSEEISFDDL